MLEVKIICIGKLKEKYWRDAVAEYAKRLSSFCRFSVVELNESRVPQNPNSAEISRALSEEAKAIMAAVGRSTVYALCIEGGLLSSEKLAAEVETAAIGGASSLAFVIGSSHGLDESVKALGKRISMSPMTFPHQLARVMLCEQLYRAFSINAGTKYHK
ncbi:23S rRNA (pseudouridine(1915)-N(3))-methyltransferase RlmH [Anaeromassilibacillus senegalensis]|uniref:Ribosomal RNA large subunit methyltransferase H n=1 Tax=Anaeromassilibacillus senegalensis TaxID=1673717 RepID=A0ABS9CKV3_9FIRM|nr:23S rRNA (pseudouridine(1915)-N(3))-methyltransferase RlmH [Anaeromassilibacillus senegalensis]MCF2651432.1 23S rRNA (pseudouridine(1915)-N(3))-methyltransferase RlmH [Anaeromassilibacillus senegalensis]